MTDQLLNEEPVRHFIPLHLLTIHPSASPIPPHTVPQHPCWQRWHHQDTLPLQPGGHFGDFSLLIPPGEGH